MIYTLTVNCIGGAYWQEPCRRVIEIDDRATLDDLHYAIQKAVDFDDDHLYEFYAARGVRSRPRYTIGEAPEGMAMGGMTDNLMATLMAFRGRSGRGAPGNDEFREWAARLAQNENPGLREIYPLPKRLKLYYWFDFGDDWKFEITKARQDKEREPRVKYPRVIESVGPNPKQYPNENEY